MRINKNKIVYMEVKMFVIDKWQLCTNLIYFITFYITFVVLCKGKKLVENDNIYSLTHSLTHLITQFLSNRLTYMRPQGLWNNFRNVVITPTQQYFYTYCDIPFEIQSVLLYWLVHILCGKILVLFNIGSSKQTLLK